MRKNREALQWVAGLETPDRTYIPHVFNFGAFQEWEDMKKRYTQRQIQEALKNPLRVANGLLAAKRLPKLFLISGCPITY